MSRPLSPAVISTEVDLSLVPQVDGATEAAFVSSYSWGPVEQVVRISSETELVETFGKPSIDGDLAQWWFTAADYLSYGSNLLTARIVDYDTAKNATAGGVGILIKNKDVYPSVLPAASAAGVRWAAKYAGKLGNSLAVIVVDSSVANASTWALTFATAATGVAVGDKVYVGAGATASITNEWAAGDEVGTVVSVTSPTQVVVKSTVVGFPDEVDVRTIVPETVEVDGLVSVSGTVVKFNHDDVLNNVAVGNVVLRDSIEIGVVSEIVNATTLEVTLSPGVAIAVSDLLEIRALVDVNVDVTAAVSTPASSFVAAGINVLSVIEGKPSTSPAAVAAGKLTAKDELHVLVVDEDGSFTGVAGTLLERFSYLSKAIDAKDENGASLYYGDVINAKSRYVWFVSHPAAATNWGQALASATFTDFVTLPTIDVSTLANGSDGVPAINGSSVSLEASAAYSLISDSETLSYNLLISGPTTLAHQKQLVGIANSRKDCVVFVSPPENLVVDYIGNDVQISANVVQWAGVDLNVNSSYAVADSGWYRRYDVYNDKFWWVPLNGQIAGLCAATDENSGPWLSPAGYNRGVLNNVYSLAWNPRTVNRDSLYEVGVNAVISRIGVGTVLWGDKTLLARPSAFSRINVRRLFLHVEKIVGELGKFVVYELNNIQTRAGFVNKVDPVLRLIKDRGGLYDYRIVCDETNNTPLVVDNNEFVCDIFVKPARSINWVRLRYIASPTGADFDSLVIS